MRCFRLCGDWACACALIFELKIRTERAVMRCEILSFIYFVKILKKY